jgi:hypothetical protein
MLIWQAAVPLPLRSALQDLEGLLTRYDQAYHVAPGDADAKLAMDEMWRVYEAFKDKFESSHYRQEGYGACP